MNFGCFHQDCIEKLKEKHVPCKPGQEQKERSEIGGLWCMVYRTVMRKYNKGIGWNKR